MVVEDEKHFSDAIQGTSSTHSQSLPLLLRLVGVALVRVASCLGFVPVQLLGNPFNETTSERLCIDNLVNIDAELGRFLAPVPHKGSPQGVSRYAVRVIDY